MSEVNGLKINKLRKRVKVAVRRSSDLNGGVESETLDSAKRGVKGYGKDSRSRRVNDDGVVDERPSIKRENAGRRVRLKTVKSERFGRDKQSDEFVERKSIRRETKRFSEDHYGDENNREYRGRRGVESNNRDNRIRGGKERYEAASRGDIKLNSRGDKKSDEFVERKNIRRETKRFSDDHYGDENNREYRGRRSVESNNRDNRIRGGKERYETASPGDIKLNSRSYDMKRKRTYADRNPDDESTFQENLKTSDRKYHSKEGSSKFRDDMVDNRRTRRGLSNDSDQSSWKKSPSGSRNSGHGESNDERGGMNFRGNGKSFNKVGVSERSVSGNGRLKIPERSKFEFSKRFDQKTSTAESFLSSSKKKILYKKNLTEDAATKDSRPRKKKRVFRLDPSDVSNKRMEDETATIDGAKVKKEESDSSKNGEMSMNAQFRAIQPSPSILSFVEGNLLGRRREIEFRNAGFNIELPVPLDNIPESSEKARIEEPIFRNKLEFYAAAKISSSFPPPDPAEIAFAGRSNVGKSSLLNALTRQWGVARTSDKPGLTQTINFFKLGEKISLVDLPGYGFAYAKEETKEAWEELVKEYVSTRVGLKRVCLLIDTKWGMKQTDHELIDLMERSKTKYQIILTKTDLSFPIDVARRAMQIEQNLAAKKSAVQPVMMVSSKTGAGIRSLGTVLGKAARFLKL